MSFITENGAAKQTPQEQLNDQANEVGGVRNARFGSWGDEGMTFDGEEPHDGDAARDERQIQQRTDFNEEHDADGRFASGSGGGGGESGKNHLGEAFEHGRDTAKTSSEHMNAGKAHALKAVEEHAKGNHEAAKEHAEKAKEHGEKAKEAEKKEKEHGGGGEGAAGAFFDFLNNPLGFFKGGGEGGEGAAAEHEAKAGVEKAEIHGFGAGGQGGALLPKHHHTERIDGSPDQARDDHGRFAGGGSSDTPKKNEALSTPRTFVGSENPDHSWNGQLVGKSNETWKDHYDKHPDLGGKANADRARDVQAPIVNAALAGKVTAASLNEKKTAILTMGGPASGKGVVLDHLKNAGLDLTHFVHVDPDEVKSQLPEYKASVPNAERSAAGAPTFRGAAAQVHEESSDIAKQIRDKAIAGGHHLVVDGTGGNAANFEKLMTRLKDNGYDVHVHYPHLDVEEGVKRAAARAENTGRYVPPEVIRGTYAKIAGARDQIMKAAPNLTIYDARERTPGDRSTSHHVVYQKQEGQATHVLDAPFMKGLTGKDHFDGSPDQPRDDHGRFGSGGSVTDKDAVADKLVGEMQTHPYGFSWRPDTGHAATGIMVSEPASAGFSKVIELHKLESKEEVRAAMHDEVRDYVRKNLDTVMKDPALHFGGWLDKDEKGSRFYLDVSRQHPQSDRQGAIDAGVRHNQKAVWDIDAGAEIKTGGDGT